MTIKDRRAALEEPYLRWRCERNRLLDAAAFIDDDTAYQLRLSTFLSAMRNMHLALEEFMALSRHERRSSDVQ
ncbi:hypothetical protein [Piscinibacter koreensis]|uniref:Uncharacterized protein n=1 Tax=Piscinibacter koreensis TaxID=2742824 RepID=A0A7Y6TYG8_9BURK|nr:hypothetical protein [Schlegelella koreensis]NUZ08076.1 hypothetical protein [Schlegelella koreensis]